MTIRTVEAVWLNTSDICSLEHIMEVSGLARDDILNLIETGILTPSNDDPHNYFFHTECIVVARTARRLRDDFELDEQGLAIAMRLLGRIKDLESELASLRSRVRPFTRQP
ncbi:chaperone modulator CbpM [Pollutimonas sp. H1-120]|uniref:chaperone modulator CbpM n=1 Tax=Pollutimonas sp. H1-120 TaxID=3148824 RepID=UPI003B5248AE